MMCLRTATPTPASAAYGRVALCAFVCAMTSLARAANPVAGYPGYSQGSSSTDARFGAQLGAGSQWESDLAQPGGGAPIVSFGGNARLGCSGVDFNGFLQSFNPHEILTEIRNSMLAGAQAAASNYLITLAYANPTISSVLDMMDKKYSARFSAFAQACDSQAARSRGQDAGARAMAAAGDQCFDREVGRGTAPTEAYRRCSILHSFESLDLPATASNADFLRKYTRVNVTREMEALLALLPDERVDHGTYQMRPALITLTSMTGRLRSLSRTALDRIDAGAEPASIAVCSGQEMLSAPGSRDACLPSGAATLLASNVFRSSQLLGPASRTLFKDALSTQIAITSMYTKLLDLFQQAARIDVRPGSGADAAHAGARRHQLQEAISQLLAEADIQVKAQAAKAQLLRSQILALEQVEAALNARSSGLQGEARQPQFGMRDLLGFFTDRN